MDNINGINNILTNGLKVYPNPASEYIQIDLPKEFIYGTIQIIDLSGRISLDKRISKANSTINISELETGIYLIKLIENSNVFTNRLIIK